MRRSLVPGVVALVVLGACGRVGFEELDRPLAITAASERPNLNTQTQLAVTGGAGLYTFSVAGTGTLDTASLQFRSPSYPGTATVTVTDARGDEATVELSFGGDYVYVVGGFDNGVAHADVWRTTDGTMWELAGQLPEPRVASAVIVHDDRLFVFGGGNTVDGPSFDQIWRSDDGVTWTEVGTLPEAAHGQAVAVFRGRIWLVGGYGNSVIFMDSVWSSADGLVWQFEGRLPIHIHGSILVPFGDELWLVAGHDDVDRTDQVHRRLDDGSWAPVGNVPVPGEYHGATIYDGRLWVAGGTGLGDRVVTTSDGVTWTDTTRLPIARQHLTLLDRGNELWVVGGIPSQTLRSADATTWSAYPPFPALLEGSGVVQFTPH